MIDDFQKIQCPLCSSQAEQVGKKGATRHILCDKCGEYVIIYPVEKLIKTGNYDNIKHLLIGQIYEYMIDKKEPFFIGYDQLNDSLELTLAEKLYKLSKYLWFQTQKYGYDKENLHIIPEQSYCKDMKELEYLSRILRDMGITVGGISSVSTGSFTSYGSSIRLSPKAIIAYENGIPDIETFKEIFMLSSKNGGKYNFTINNPKNTQLNIANDNSKIEATQIINPVINELLEMLRNLQTQVPENLPPAKITQISDSISAVVSETTKPKPNKNIINTLLNGINGIANTAAFGASVATVIDFVMKNL
jgi:hypothetical protein